MDGGGSGPELCQVCIRAGRVSERAFYLKLNVDQMAHAWRAAALLYTTHLICCVSADLGASETRPGGQPHTPPCPVASPLIQLSARLSQYGMSRFL